MWSVFLDRYGDHGHKFLSVAIQILDWALEKIDFPRDCLSDQVPLCSLEQRLRLPFLFGQFHGKAGVDDSVVRTMLGWVYLTTRSSFSRAR